MIIEKMSAGFVRLTALVATNRARGIGGGPVPAWGPDYCPLGGRPRRRFWRYTFTGSAVHNGACCLMRIDRFAGQRRGSLERFTQQAVTGLPGCHRFWAVVVKVVLQTASPFSRKESRALLVIFLDSLLRRAMISEARPLRRW
jgi:hypothetical protein